MDISLPVAERTTTGTVTKEATDSSVSITADWSQTHVNVSAISDGVIIQLEELIQEESQQQSYSAEPSETFPVLITLPDNYYRGSNMSVTVNNPNISIGTFDVNDDYKSCLAILQNKSSQSQSVVITFTYQVITGYRQIAPASRTVSLTGVPTGYSSYSIVSYSIDAGGSATVSLSTDGQKVTISNWSGSAKPAKPEDWSDDYGVITVTCTVRCTNRYISGYSGYAYVAIEDTSPYDIEVSSVSSGVTSYSSPYYSSGNIRCTLYANYSTNASVTFSYKVDTTVTEKYFNVNFNGVDVEEVNFNGVDLDPNA